MEKILKKLLDDLAAVAEGDNEEIFDTDVREQMFDAVWSGYISPKTGYELPDSFGMFSDEGNRGIKTALEVFLPAAGEYAKTNGLTTAQERLESIQNDEVTGGDEEFTHDDFFGYLESADDFAE